MIEIYLFVNPLGDICLNVEKDILKLVQTENKKIQFRFIPLVNMKTIDYLMKLAGIPSSDISKRNRLFETLYSAALDCKTAQLQGKKKGRHLLLGLQQAVAVDQVSYSVNLSEKLLLEAGGDLAMFQADRHSDFVKESFQADQQIAREMGVVSHPSAVIYNYDCDRDFGVRVENCISMDEIRQLCKTTKDKLYLPSSTMNSTIYSEQKQPGQHLHLL